MNGIPGRSPFLQIVFINLYLFLIFMIVYSIFSAGFCHTNTELDKRQEEPSQGSDRLFQHLKLN